MEFDIYKIASPVLRPYVQYVLFNYSADKSCAQVVTSYANTNICLGIVKDKELYSREDGVKELRQRPGVHAYLSGMYLPPHRFEAQGTLDEICIDLTPLGYYRFFRFPAQTYILGEDLLTEGFGSGAKEFFERVFGVACFQERGAMVERFLLEHMITADTAFLQQCLYCIHRSDGDVSLHELSVQVRCSEKKIVRAFVSSFDLTPKDYIRIVRFRRALAGINSGHGRLTSVCYDSNYYDQSHFIRDFRFFTGKTPRQLKDSLTDVKQQVIIGVE